MGKVKNVEFKARVAEIESYEHKLLALNPELKGLDHQVDTYFNVPQGRLKLREGNIENALIQYNRENLAGSRQSDVILYQHQPDPALKEILTLQFGIKKIVDKKRKIYFVDNVKFHFDVVAGLGTFIEVEAIDSTGDLTSEYLKSQCDYYKDFFGLNDRDMMEGSYSDML
ncbi:MAG TPA: class IV adenylate cyclase [Chitinophagaceae bacterium]|nr:class IV adenylate cyclase [Chitinophagaceae bacterium]